MKKNITKIILSFLVISFLLISHNRKNVIVLADNNKEKIEFWIEIDGKKELSVEEFYQSLGKLEFGDTTYYDLKFDLFAKATNNQTYKLPVIEFGIKNDNNMFTSPGVHESRKLPGGIPPLERNVWTIVDSDGLFEGVYQDLKISNQINTQYFDGFEVNDKEQKIATYNYYLDYETMLSQNFYIEMIFDLSSTNPIEHVGIIQYIEDGITKNFAMEDISFIPFKVGDPDAGPNTNLKSLKLTGDGTEYPVDLSSDNDDNTFNTDLTISYADSKNSQLHVICEAVKSTNSINVTEIKESDQYKTGDKIIVTVEETEGETTHKKTYTITLIVEKADTDTRLIDYNIVTYGSGKVLTNLVSKTEENTYEIVVDFNATQIDINPIVAELSSVNPSILEFRGLEVKSPQTKKITVTAENGATKDYHFIVTRQKGDSSKDFTLKVNNEVITKSDKLYYKNLPENVSNFSINISDFSSTTDVYYATSEITDETIESGYTKLPTTGNISNTIGKGKTITYTIRSVAQDGTVELSYVKIERDKSSDTSIVDVEIIENASSKQNKETLVVLDNTYKYTVYYEEKGKIIINVILKSDQNSTYKILDKNNISITELSTDLLDVGENNFTIVVTAENESTETYNLVINKQSTEKELVEIILKDTDNLARDPLANGFDSVVAAGDKKFTYDSALKTYYYTISYEDVTNFSVTIRTSPNSKIIYNSETSVSNERVFTGSFTEISLANREFTNIIIKAENGSVTDNFTIRVTRAAADTNKYLDNIVINGDGLNGFLKTKKTYETQILPRGTNTVDVDAILPSDSKAKIEYYVNNNKIDGTTIDLNGKNPIKLEIRVTSQSGDSFVYNLEFVAGSDENKITSISLSNETGYNFPFSFNQATTAYNITVPYTVNYVSVSATASEAATITGATDYVLTAGEGRTITVYATSELNTKGQEYKITITREQGRNYKELSQLSYLIDGFPEVTFNLYSTEYKYEALQSYNRNITSVEITARISGSQGERFEEVEGTEFKETYELKPGKNELLIYVLDEMGKRQTYTVVIDIYDDNNTFSTINVDNIDYDLSSFKNNQLIIEKEYLFNDGDVKFVVNKESAYSELKITANNNAKYHTTPGYGMLDFKAGFTTIVKFSITAENGTESEEYEVHITKLAANKLTSLNELKISLPNGNSIYSETNLSGNNTINLRVDRNINSINIEAVLLQAQRSKISGLDLDSQTTDYLNYIETINLSPAGSTTTYYFDVIAEDGITKSRYTINTIRKNIDSEVTNLTIKNGLEVLYNGEYKDITLDDFPNSVNNLTMIIITNDPFARVFVGDSQKSGTDGVFEFSVSLLVGENNINLSVRTELLNTDTPSDEYSSNEIKITYHRKAARTTALLDTLTITYNNGNNVLVSYTNKDEIPTIIEGLNLVRDIKSVFITATAKDGGTVTGSTGSRNLTPGGISSFSLQVTPENKGEGREYTIYISNKNENNTITDITIDGEDIEFHQERYLYDFTSNPYPYTKNNIDIFVESDNFATITNSGLKPLNYNLVDGINEFKIYATSELGEKGQEYIIRVKVIPPYENTSLESLVVTDEKGTILPFSTGEYTQGYFSYTINLEPNQIISQINILAVLLNDDKQSFDRDLSTPISIVTNQDGTIDQTITFVVSAENNKKSEYTIRINKGLVLSDSNDIINIAIAEVKNFLFNQATTAYELTVPYSINFLTLNVTASEKANITGSGKHNLNEGETQIIVYATSESGKEGTKYSITVTRLEASTNSELDEIEIYLANNKSNYLLGNNDRNPKVTYNKEISTYEINLGIEYLNKIISLSTTKGHLYQNIQMFNITGNTKQLTYGENQFSILVTAEDTNYATTYFVVINVKNETNDLEQLIINSENINFKEDPINPYITEEKTASITYKGLNNGEVILYDSNNNTITSGSTVNLLDGDNHFTITVKNEYGEEVDSYEFTITRNPSKDTSITDAILFDSTNKNYLNFNENTIEYNISVASNIDKLTLNITPNHPLAVVTGNGTYNIKLDETTTVEFYITAEDGITVSNTYVINVLRESLSTNQYLDEITIRTLNSTYLLGDTFRNPLELFNKETQTHTINLDIDYISKSLIVGYTQGHNNQKITLIGLINNTTLILKEGLNTFSIDIQPEDTTAEPFVYTININVRNKHNDLDYLKINDELINLDNESIEIETEDESILIDYKPINNGKVTIKDKDGNEISNKLDLDYGDNLITIVIENEYNEVVKEYEINIIRNKSSNNNILDVILNDNENNNYLSFDKDIFEYEITIPYYIDNINLLINAEHYLANTYINNVLTNAANFELIAGEELTVNFYVVAENDDESAHYTIHIIRDYNTDNKLASLTTTTNIQTLLDVDFDKENYYYYFQVNEEHELVIFEFELNYGQTVINIISGVAHSLNHGLNTFEIEVIAEDPNTDSSVYVIEIEMINSSVEVEEILVDNKDIYEEGKTNYILDAVSSDINEIELIVNPKDNNADVVITVEGKVITDGLIPLIPGINEVVIRITSEDGTNVEEYTITIEQLLETYDLLDELIIKTNKETYLLGLEDKNPEVMFNAETFTYSITVNETVEFIKMNYVLGSQKQTIIGDFDVELNINHGLNTCIVEVYPEDPTLEGNIYIIEITKVYENIDLETLLVEGEDIYIENKTSYELDNLTTDTKSIIVIPTLTNEYGTYEIKDTNGNIITNNEVPVYFGNNKITITLTSEDGSVTKEYTINFEQVLSSNNEVIDLEVIDLANNVNKIIFDNNTLTYDVKFNYSSENARIRITTNDKAKVYINNIYKSINREDFVLVPGESRLVSIYVEAEDGTQGEIYQVNIYRMTEDEGRMSDNNKLRDLKLEIPLDEIPFNFEQNKLEYTIRVPYTAEEIYLKGYPEHHGATVHNEGAYRLEVGSNDPIYIRVQAEDGTPSRIQYKVTFIREEPNTDTSLKDLVVKDLNGNILEFDNNVKFDSDNRIYTITLDKESYINQVRIEAELNNPTQKIFGNGVLSLHGEIEGQYNTVLPVTVVAEDGSSEDYIIYILHDLDFSNITEIKDISIIGDDRISYFGLEFEGDIYNYDVYVPFNVLETRLIVQTLGNIIYLDSKDNEIEDNRLQQFDIDNLIIYRFKIQSMNEQNESPIYEIKVNREVADSNALLDTILIDGKEILGFDPNQNNYLYIQYILDPNKIDLLAKPQSETSIVSGNRTYTLTEGESTFISITVTAQDKTTNTYIVEVKYVNSNALLGELSVYELDEFGNEFQIPIELKPGEFNYTVQIDRNTSLINIKGSGEDQGGARLRGFGQYRIGDTDLVIPITVTSGDGTEERTYLVTITKSMRGDASLETVLINDGNGNIVYDFTAPYKVSNDSNIITLSAKPKDGNARVYFNDEYSSNGQFNINDLDPGQTSILIRVESEDGQTVKTYVVNLAKDYQPDLLLTILLITSLLLWIITILVLIIIKNRKEKVDQNQLIF